MTTLSTTDVTNGTTADGNVVNTNFGNVRTVVNGNIDNANISASAAIAVSKLAAGTEGHYLQTVGGQPAWAAGPAGGTGVPTGCVLPYSGAAAPSGYLLCDGTAVSRTTYSDLFAICGTAYGVGDGSTTFNLPDMRGRMAFGKGTHTDVDALGDNDGETTVGNRRAKHKHTVDTHSGHTHTVTGVQSVGTAEIGGNGPVKEFWESQPRTTSSSGSHTHAVGPTSAVTTDSSGFLVFNFIIKT